MKILVTGASGLLGAHLMAVLSRRHEVVGVDRHPWWGDRSADVRLADLTEPQAVADVVASVAPDVVVHCAGLVSVDACERDPGLAYRSNAGITGTLARSVAPDCLFVYIATDGIFKGDAPFATEEQLPCPRTVYGRSKLQGEWEVMLAARSHLIVRTNFYGWSSGRKQTAAEWLYHVLESGEAATLFTDFFYTPMYVVDFVERLELLIQGGHRGIVHLAGRDRVSKAQFARLLAEVAGLSLEHVRWGSVDDAPLAAARPKDMSLSSEHFRRLTGANLPGCLSGLRRFVADRHRPLSGRFDGTPVRGRRQVLQAPRA